MWPFKEKHTAEDTLPELSTIRFDKWSYTPQPDITPYEVALLLPLFVYPLWRADYQGWIDKNNLRRHFTKTEE